MIMPGIPGGRADRADGRSAERRPGRGRTRGPGPGRRCRATGSGRGAAPVDRPAPRRSGRPLPHPAAPARGRAAASCHVRDPAAGFAGPGAHRVGISRDPVERQRAAMLRPGHAC